MVVRGFRSSATAPTISPGRRCFPGNAVDGLSITGNGTYNFQTIDALNNGDDGIEITSTSGSFTTTGGTISGNGDIGVKIDPINANVVLTSITHSGGTSGIVLDDVAGSFTVTGATTISNTSGPAIAFSNAPASIRLADITITNPGDGMTFAGTNGPVVVGGIVITGLGSGATGLDFSGSNTTFTAQSVTILGTAAAGSIGIDLSATSSALITIANGGAIANVDTGVRLGMAGSPANTANANFTFGGGTIAGLSASIDVRGLNPISGSYVFGPTVFIGPQVFAANNVIFVGSAATGAGDGSSVNDLATIATADGNTAADAVFALVNDGAAIDDADGFTLANGQTLASFGNGRQFSLGGVPFNVIGTNVRYGAIQGDPGGGAATLTSGAAGGTVTLGDGTFVADINLAGTGSGNVVTLGNGATLSGLVISGGSIGILGNNISGATLTNVAVIGAGAHGASFAGTSTNIGASNFAASVSGGSGLSITSSGLFSFTGTTLLSGNAADGVTIAGAGVYDFQTLNALNNAGDGIDVSAGATFRTTGGTISGNSARGLALATVTAELVLNSITHDGGTNGIDLDTVAGSLTVNGATAITNTSGAGIVLANTAATINFTGTTTIAGSTNAGLLANNFDGTASFADLDITGGNTGIAVLNDSSGTLGFGAPGSVANTSGVAFSIGSSTPTVTYDGTITQNSAANAVDIDAMTGGAATFAGPITASTGTAVAIDGTSGNITFSGDIVASGGGQVFAIGATTAPVGGTITFSGTNLTATGGGGAAIASLGAGATVNVSAAVSVAGSADAGISVSNAAGEVTFGVVSVTNSADDGISISNSTGALTFGGQTTITNPGAAGVDIEGANGNIGFAGLEIALGTVNTTGLDLSTAVVGAGTSISAGDFDVDGGGFAGTLGVDLSATTGAGLVRLGDAVNDNPAGQSSTITNVANGVRFSASTNLGDAATDGFTFGDGAVPAESLIQTTGGLVIDGVLTPNGRYNFRDATLVGDTSNLAVGLSLYYVDDAADGIDDGTREHPGTIAAAALSPADAIILVNAAGDTDDTIDISLQPGGVGSLDLDPNQRLYSFAAGDTLVLGGGAPPNFLLTGITSGSIANPGTGTPTLTTTGVGANTITLDNNNIISGVVVQNGSGGAAIAGIGVNDLTLDASTVGTLSGASAGGLALANATGVATITDTTLRSLAISGGSIGINALGADIDGNGGSTAFSVVGGHTGTIEFDAASTIAQTGAATAVSIVGKAAGSVTFGGPVNASTSTAQAIVLTGNAGSIINFNNGLQVATTSGAGFTASGGGTISVTGTGNSINTGTGTALDLAGMSIGAGGFTVAGVGASGATTGIALTEVAGGAINLGAVNLQGITSRGVDVTTSLGSALSFSSLTVGLAANAVGFDLAGAAINAAITANDFDVDGGGNVGTLGLDMTGTTGAGLIQLGDLNNTNPAPGGQTSTILNVARGVLVSSATNANLVFGDGQSPAESRIETFANGRIIDTAGALPAAGSYDFDDVTFVGDTSNLAPVSLYFVDPDGDGDGSLVNPGSVGGAEGSAANVIVLIDPIADANGVINMGLVAHQGSDANPNSLNLDDGQVLISFSSGSPATIDVAALGVDANAGAPASFSFTTIQNSTVINRPDGLTAIRPTLTTNAGSRHGAASNREPGRKNHLGHRQCGDDQHRHRRRRAVGRQSACDIRHPQQFHHCQQRRRHRHLHDSGRGGRRADPVRRRQYSSGRRRRARRGVRRPEPYGDDEHARHPLLRRQFRHRRHRWRRPVQQCPLRRERRCRRPGGQRRDSDGGNDRRACPGRRYRVA